MARKTSKTKPTVTKANPEAEDAVIEAENVETPAEDIEAAALESEAATETVTESVTETQEPPVEDRLEVGEEAGAPEAAVAETSGPTAAPPAPVVRKAGFVPMVFGGVVAAALGFGAALYVLPNLPAAWLPAPREDITAALTQKLEAQSQEIAALQAMSADRGALEALEARVSDVSGQMSRLAGEIEALKASEDAIARLAARIGALEKAPVATASPLAVEAYQREMEALRAEIGAMTAQAEAKRASAEMTAQEALRRSAMSQILTSLETGSQFGDALQSLSATGVDVPEALAAQAAGVPTVAELSAEFPDVAREALGGARRAEGGEGFGAFLKSQLNVRSLEPREGSDSDAVLSRIEAAVREGRLGDVLAEAAGLPEAARAPLQGWLEAVTARQAATLAAEALRQTVNGN